MIPIHVLQTPKGEVDNLKKILNECGFEHLTLDKKELDKVRITIDPQGSG